ncbi:DUF6438 domain-containing protein [Sphingomonas sp. PB4P5]|uniref:DUF6438 domain-containing protein n=1 Tax=Parasphingomonas puruogangriensis TaxID=3096155 RepID=UPI002FCBF480
MPKTIWSIAPLIAPLALGACATTGALAPTAPAETISWSIGPCFGFCPVYSVAVSSRGAVTFDGERHTATLGRQERQLSQAAYRAVAASLANYRPARGTTQQTVCEQQISDQSLTRISWTAADGSVTTLEHNKGCRSARNTALEAVIGKLPAMLGIEPWTRQTTRPGVSRG